ncbi:MAG: NADPH:quinone reductase [Gammaproteobacteria bacterium]|nr:NADPH:quinone reductase [Gammaproteobacteria bacterium]
MKVIEVRNFGGPEVMELIEKTEPQVGRGELVVRVAAIGVNPVETYIRAGTYPRLPDLPYTPGGNIAGVIESCGSGVTDWKEGDRVYSVATLSGGYGEKTLCSSDQIFKLPDNLSFAQGTAIGVPAATAWRALFLRGDGKRGERVLIHGASGSVGQAAIQLAKSAGLHVFGTAGSDEGCELVERLGAERACSHNHSGYEAKLLKATSSKGFDLILEMLANKNLEKDLDLLAAKGRVVVIGSRGRIEIDPRATMGKETDIRGLALFNGTPAEVAATHAALQKAMESGTLVPTVSREMVLADAPKAHELVMKDGNCGRIVLIP